MQLVGVEPPCDPDHQYIGLTFSDARRRCSLTPDSACHSERQQLKH